MKIEFDDWEQAHRGSSFVLNMECAPRVGETVLIHKDFFPACYFEDAYIENPMQELHDGFIRATVSIVEHKVTKDGHTVCVCIDV